MSRNVERVLTFRDRERAREGQEAREKIEEQELHHVAHNIGFITFGHLVATCWVLPQV